jgi:hypothetical protein
MATDSSASVALVNQRQAKADWAVARRRMRAGTIIPVHRPTFQLTRDDTIFTMGSCFARNIEQHLARLGCRVPANDYTLPEHERASPTPNDVLTLFTPPSFLQLIEWVERIYVRDGKVTRADCEEWLFHYPDGSVWDLGLAAVRPIGIERVIARRQEIFDLYRAAFSAECVMMTPGLVEGWFDNLHGRYTIYAPLDNRKVLDGNRFTFRVLDYDDCHQALSRCIEIIRAHNPRVKILITVSPVPLRYTFTDRDILTANSYSKAVLRAVCEKLVQSGERIDYFPSFEAVNYSTSRVWQRDRRHVSDAMVGKIVGTVIAQYFLAAPEEAPDKYRHTLLQRLLASFGGFEPSGI